MTARERARERLLAVRFGVLGGIIVAALAGIMLAPPVLRHPVGGQILLSVPVFAGLYLAGRSAARAAEALGVIVLSTVVGAVAVAQRSALLISIDALVHALVLAVVITWVVREVVRDRRVSLDTILGAICAYLLVGFLYSNLFRAVHALDPGALVSQSGPLDPLRDRSSIFYFAYVTLTTVAYGDITPASPLARLLSMTEGMIGQLYPTIFIARLVSLSISQRD